MLCALFDPACALATSVRLPDLSWRLYHDCVGAGESAYGRERTWRRIVHDCHESGEWTSNLLSYSSLRPVLFLFLSLPLYSKYLLPSNSLTLPQEYLVVNDIIASPFGVSHMMANLYYNIHRIVYATAPKLLSYPWLNRANEVSPSSDSVVP